MRVALVNPPWTFEGSIYFGCREPHLALEYGYAKALLEGAGHDVLVVDAQLEGIGDGEVRERLGRYRPEMTVLTTAPSYLFWRCAPPELRVPMATAKAIRDRAGILVVVGPHASTTPSPTLRKLGADLAVVGECEDVLVALASAPSREAGHASVAWLDERGLQGSVEKHATEMTQVPALRWPRGLLSKHAHHHHRFDRPAEGWGAEIEASRGCPYHCTFCAKDNFRNGFRKRPLDTVLAELDGLISDGARYVYFIDEIFLPDRNLLEALVDRDVAFGVQLRIDNWTPDMLDLLGAAGCVSIEAGMESITRHGRSLLAKNCRLSTEELTERLIHAKRTIPFVQANLLDATCDTREEVQAWRARLHEAGVWANDPVPLFPYPGSPEFTLRFGPCEDDAWERAHAHYLGRFAEFSDVQDERPKRLCELEATHD